MIEEYFKALKNGCQIKKLQLETYENLLRAVPIYIPVAWLALRLKKLERQGGGEQPAALGLTPNQIAIVSAISTKAISDTQTLKQALSIIAKKGGHIPNNGPPGWMVIIRGLQAIAQMEKAFKVAQRVGNCDQS